jgi:hypothetical protein
MASPRRRHSRCLAFKTPESPARAPACVFFVRTLAGAHRLQRVRWQLRILCEL